MNVISASFPDTVIRASAGTGKTYQLTNRFLGLLQSGEHADQILASTFARKAAGEVLERVLTRLAEAAIDQDKRAELAAALKLNSLSAARCATLLEGVVRQIHRLRVGTLDSFFFQTVGSFSLEFGLPGGWTILEEIDDRAIRIEALRRLLKRDTRDFNDLITLLSLLQKGESSRDVLDSLLATVTNFYSVYRESPSEAWHRFQPHPMLKDDAFKQAIEVLRSAPIPAHKAIEKSHLASIDQLEQQDWQTFLTKGYPSKICAGEDLYYQKPIEPDLSDAYAPLIDHARAALVNQLLYQTTATFQLLEQYRDLYESLKVGHRGLRFEDLTFILSRFLNEDQLPQIEYRLDASIQHLLLDEFQDTSLPQWQVIRHFSRQVNRAPDKSFFCVGDVKQAIYGWRGGEAEIFESITSTFDGIAQESLTKSFRSAPAVIETVNRVFLNLGQNPSLFPKDAFPDLLGPVRHNWGERFQEHQTARTDLAGHCSLRTYPVDDDGKCPNKLQYETTARFVAEQRAAHPGCSIAVLTRSNKAVAQIIYRLRNPRPGVHAPVFASEEGGNPLTDSACVIFILSVFKLAAHPGDLIARFNVVHSPLGRQLGLTEFQRYDSHAESLAREIRKQLLREGYGKTIDAWVRAIAPVCDRRELDRLEQLVEMAWKYESRATLDPYDFVRFVEQTKVESPSSADVRVMTVHQSKGLQFDIVVLPELQGPILAGQDNYIMQREQPTEPISGIMRSFSKKLYPVMPVEIQQMYSSHCNRLMNEALCLLYVAMTRAVHAMHILVPPKPKHQTPAQLLVHALANDVPAPDQVLYAHGNPDWYESHREQFARDNRPATIAEPTPIALAPSNKKRKRNLEYVTPSSQGDESMLISDALHAHQSHARRRGSLIHAWFEQVEWLDDGPPDEERLRDVAGRFLLESLDLDQQLSAFRVMLDAPNLRENLTLSTYRSVVAPRLFPQLADRLSANAIEFEVLREQRVTYRTDTQLVNGIADRIVLYREHGQLVAADVIDYKSDGANSPARITTLTEKYRGQLKLYGQGLKTLYHLDDGSISLRLGFVEAGQVVEAR